MNNWVTRRAFAEFFRDLLAGDAVALGICFGFVVFFLILAALSGWIVWNRQQTAEKFRKKTAAKRKKEDEQYKASKKTKEI